MPTFGSASKSKLITCHSEIQRVMNEVVKYFDCSIICGFRTQEEQERAFGSGKSNARYGESPHNFSPSMAVDVVPYPLDWGDRERMIYFAGQVIAIARTMGIGLKWGGDWDGDTQLNNNTFDDLPHFELANWRELI